MSKERRAYQRRPVSWEAEASGAGYGPLACEIRDFCEGGLFLVASTRTADRQLREHCRRGAPMRLMIADPVTSARHQTDVAVVRAAGDGIGVVFQAPEPDLVTGLATVAASGRSAAAGDLQPASGQPLSAGQRRLARDVLADCSGLISDFLSSRLENFLVQAEAALLQAADEATATATQAAHFGGMRMLNKHRNQFTDSIVRLTLENWRQLGRFSISPEQAFASRGGELSLVDEGEFEDWLQRSEAISRAESRAIRGLRNLQRRLSAATGQRIDEYANPMSPAVLCQCLSDQLAIFRPDRAACGVIYRSFGKALLNQLGVVYSSLNSRLGEAGILPDLEDERPRIVRVRDGGRYRGDLDTLHQSKPEATAGDVGGDPLISPPPAVLGGLYRTVRDLFRASREAPDADTSSPRTSPPPPPVLLGEALAALRAAPAPADDLPLRERLRRELRQRSGDESADLAPEQAEQVDFLEHWFSELRPGDDDGGFFRQWSTRLVPQALSDELREGSFLQARDGPIHELINALDRAASTIAGASPEERDRLRTGFEASLRDLLEYGPSADGMREAARALDADLERPRRAVEAGMERVRQSCEGSQRLGVAKEAVEEALHARLGERAVPSPVLRLIEAGWRNHLVLIALRHGEDSEQWRRGLKVVDVLPAALGSVDYPRQRIRNPGSLLGYVEQVLTQAGRPPADIRSLVGELSRWLKEPIDAPPPPSGRFQPLPANSPPTAEPALPQEWLGHAKLLNPGDWVRLADETGTPRPLRLAWVSRHRDRYVFVDRAGRQAASLGLGELAEALGGQPDASEDLDTPATLRRWQDMLVKLNQQLTHQANHDPLTGLLNRKAMQRRLRHLLDRPEGARAGHVFCQFALDDFKVVNHTIGHDGGDQTLRAVAEMLQEEAGRRILLARMGGDEFAALMVRTGEEEAAAFVQRQLGRLRERRFGTTATPVRLTASVGMVGFTRESNSEESLLRDVDNACFRAKENGGNRYHLVKPDDSELADLQHSMDQATRVDRALEAGLLELRCQRIQPLQDAGLQPMFEVLISMTGDGPQPIAPDQFIPAAERFGRMPALDRWVIREVVDWCRSNPEALRGIGALSINLSGQTLGDVGLLDYLSTEIRGGRLDPGKLCFEITETAIMANLSSGADLIRALRELGCGFALDDFGSGLASYSYLRNLPTDFLKIDGEFIRDLDDPATDEVMVRSIHELCHHLGKTTVAEFVETERVRARLQDIGLDYAQGFGIEHPRPLRELGLS